MYKCIGGGRDTSLGHGGCRDAMEVAWVGRGGPRVAGARGSVVHAGDA